MNAFITGSRAYGKPGVHSDVDLVVRVDQITYEKLLALNGGKEPILFGELNLILCRTDEEWAVWKLGTRAMERSPHKPYNRDQAKHVLDGYREQVGILDQSQSGKE